MKRVSGAISEASVSFSVINQSGLLYIVLNRWSTPLKCTNKLQIGETAQVPLEWTYGQCTNTLISSSTYSDSQKFSLGSYWI